MHKIIVAAAIAASGILVAQAQVPSGSADRGTRQDYRPPRTPWGDPDLEGKWPGSYAAAVPLQRPESFGTRNVLTDSEFAQREAQAANQKIQDEADFDFGVEWFGEETPNSS